MLSAIAFERLLEPPKVKADKRSDSLRLAETLADLFSAFSKRQMSASSWMKCDPKYQNAQTDWPLHQKWMKELYEARSSQVHRGPKSEFSSNFEPEKHMVIAAFVFPLVVKLKLADADLYTLSSDEIASCEVLDELIDSDWGTYPDTPSEWPKILDKAQSDHKRRDAIKRAMRDVGRHG